MWRRKDDFCHHHNHHYQHHHRRQRHTSGESARTNHSSTTAASTVSLEVFAEDEHQVERYLNGTAAKHLADLRQEEKNLLAEIYDLEQQENKSNIKSSASLQQPQQELVEEEEDDELLEFQRIEREIKLSELRKCLRVIQKQIERQQQQTASSISSPCPTSLRSPPQYQQQLQFANMTDSMLEECRLDAAQQITLLDEQL